MIVRFLLSVFPKGLKILVRCSSAVGCDWIDGR